MGESSSFIIQPENKKWTLIWKGKKPRQKISCLHGQRLVLRGSFSWGEHEHLRNIVFYCDKRRLQMITKIPMGDYLKGVLPQEMPASWPLSALKAQAVTSRTYALWKRGYYKNKRYDLRSTVLDQVFKSKRPSLDRYQKRVNRAVDETVGLVLVNSGRQIIKAYFHADCGGATARAINVWGRWNKDTRAVKDPYCQTRSSHRWRYSMGLKDLANLVRDKNIAPKSGELKGLKIKTAGLGQRVNELYLVFRDRLKRISGDQLRSWLGYDKLKSTFFSVKRNGEKFEFVGKGHGHGVGLCQRGARGMAKVGKSYEQILKHYYPEAGLRLMSARAYDFAWSKEIPLRAKRFKASLTSSVLKKSKAR